MTRPAFLLLTVVTCVLGTSTAAACGCGLDLPLALAATVLAVLLHDLWMAAGFFQLALNR